jgi:hypothetical protein
MSTVCPSCGATARAVQNPFYGSGMSVHERLIDCGTCNQVAIEKNPPDDQSDVATRAPSKGGFFRRGWFRRRRP